MARSHRENFSTDKDERSRLACSIACEVRSQLESCQSLLYAVLLMQRTALFESRHKEQGWWRRPSHEEIRTLNRAILFDPLGSRGDEYPDTNNYGYSRNFTSISARASKVFVANASDRTAS